MNRIPSFLTTRVSRVELGSLDAVTESYCLATLMDRSGAACLVPDEKGERLGSIA